MTIGDFLLSLIETEAEVAGCLAKERKLKLEAEKLPADLGARLLSKANVIAEYRRSLCQKLLNM